MQTEIKPNLKQQECIDNIDGKYLVLAGPGTGKTFTMIQRIKSMIERGVNPEKILCLTFSDAAANEVRIRLEKELNKSDVGVNAYTYHGFCNEIITSNTAEFALSENIRVIPAAVSVSLLKDCIDEINSSVYRTKLNDPYYFLKEIQNGINAIKSNRLSKEQYFENLEKNPDWKPQLAALKTELAERNAQGKKIPQKLTGGIEKTEKKIAKAIELWKFYELYQSKMEEQHYFDFNDMINLVLDKFTEDSAFLSQAANKYDYILVDEYQDTNKNQNEIVFQLTKALESENVFVVGDDDQIIFTFQGARLDTIEKFLEEFPETKVICLRENMRSTQSILDAAKKIAELDTRRLENNPEFAKYNITKTLTAQNREITKKDKKVRLYRYADILQEYQEIVDEIDKLVNSADCPVDEYGEKKLSEIAILTRGNAELSTFAEMLKERNIPAELKDGKSIFEIKSSIVLYYYLQLLVNPELHTDKFFKLALSAPFNFHPKDFERLYEQKSHFRSLPDMLKAVPAELFIEPDKVQKFIKNFEHLQSYKNNETLKNVILEAGAKTGIVDYFINSEINRTENIAGLKKIIDEAVDFSNIYKKITLEDFVEYLSTCLTEDIAIKTDKAPVTMNAVQLSTYHSAKGREFEYVYMPTLLSKNWESSRRSMAPIIPLDASEYKSEDELKLMKLSDAVKLMYVGMTRAKHTLRLSYPKSDGKIAQTPTNFLSAVENNCEHEPEPFIFDVESYWTEQTRSLLKRDYDYEKDFCSMVDRYLEDKSFSPSAINKYLNCPRMFLYDNILDLSSKDGSPDSMSYGRAVHKACEFAVSYAIKNGAYPEKDVFINAFKKELNTLPMSGLQQRTIHEQRGEIKLSDYYVQMCNTPVKNLFSTEKAVEVELDGVKFYGIIDRIDKNDDGTYTIYDYKTGSAKNGKVICPNGEHEDYYNQIALYKYYFEKENSVKVKETEFIYPEEFTNNFKLPLSDDDCLAVVQKFKQAIADIRSYKFDAAMCEKSCKWCQYKDFCGYNN